MINETDYFFNTNDFAEYVVLNGKKIKAIFDRSITEHTDGFTFIKGYKPQIVCQSTDVVKSGALQGSGCVVRKLNYTVTEIEPDGTGITTVTLFQD